MKLKELKENVVVDIKSVKQCQVLMNLLENAGYPPFNRSISDSNGDFLVSVYIYPEDKTYIALYGGKSLQNSVLLEDIVELEARDSAVMENSIVVACYTTYGGSKLGYIYKPDYGAPWGIVSNFPLDAFIEYYAGKYDYIEPVNDLVKIDSEIIKDSIVYYGKDAQSTVCMEECAELIQAISKEKRGKSDKNHLAEEIADVLISISLLREIYDVSNEQINNWIDKKQKRIRSRMK